MEATDIERQYLLTTVGGRSVGQVRCRIAEASLAETRPPKIQTRTKNSRLRIS
jgi:hypothetical protein